MMMTSVARDRHQQLAVVLRLLFGGRAEGESLDLGEAVDEVGDFIAEIPAQQVERDVGVFDHIVQQRRGDGRRVHLLLGENRRDRDAVRHIVVAGHALLTLMRLRADPVGARQHLEVEAVALRGDSLRQLGRENRRRTRHKSPASAKLTYRSPPPITT